MKKLYLLLILWIPLLVACDDEVNPNAITVTRIPSQLNLLNNTDNTLYYFIIDQDAAATIFWVPMVDENQPKIDPNGQARVSLTNITGYTNESDVLIVYYWEAVMENGQLGPGPVNNFLFVL